MGVGEQHKFSSHVGIEARALMDFANFADF
jgi:hypothetical protein